jgi:hypothetical protein
MGAMGEKAGFSQNGKPFGGKHSGKEKSKMLLFSNLTLVWFFALHLGARI